MANIIGDLIVKISGDASSLTNTLAGIQANLQTFSSNASSSTKNFSKSISEQSSILQSWGNDIKTITIDEFGNKIEGTSTKLGNLSTAEQQATAQGEKFRGGLSTMSSGLMSLTYGLQQLGLSLTLGITVPLATAGTMAIKTFADWETGAAQLQAASDMSAESVSNLVKTFTDLSTVMPTTVTEFEQIAKVASEAGVSAEGLESYSIAIAKMMTYSKDLNMNNAAEALVSVSKAFGIAENNVERVASVIRKAAKESKGGMDDFVSALQNVTPAAATLGLNLTDVTAILASIIPISKSASRSGTELNSAFTQMAQKLPQMASQMGITKEALSDMMNADFVGTLEKYIEGIDNGTKKTDELAALTEIFGAVGAKAIAPLISQYDVFNKRLEELDQSYKDGTENTKDYMIAADTLTNTFKEFKNAVLALAKAVGEDLNTIIGPVLTNLIKFVSGVSAVWMWLNDTVKRFIVTLATVIALLGPFILLLSNTVGGFYGFIKAVYGATTFLKAFKVEGFATTVVVDGINVSLGALLATFGRFMLMTGAVVVGLWALYTAINAIYGYFSGGKSLMDFMFSGFDSKFDEINKKVAGSLGDLGTVATDGSKSAADALSAGASGIANSATEWGDSIMQSFTKGFKTADYTALNDVMDIFDSYFALLEKQGKLSTEGVYKNTLTGTRYVAEAIKELRDLGDISDATKSKISKLIGTTRTTSLIEELKKSLNVSDLQETIDNTNKSLDELDDKYDDEKKVLEKQIKTQEDYYDTQITAQEDLLNVIEKQKKAADKIYKKELKIYEIAVDSAEDNVDVLKNQLDTLEELNDANIEILEEQVSNAQEVLDIAKDSLDELKDANDKRIDVAEGMYEYEQMNLKALQARLTTLTSMGRSEYDTEYQYVLAQISLGEDKVDAAKNTYLATKAAADATENAAEEQITAQEDTVETLQDIVDAAKKAAKKQEKILQDQIDIQEKNLDNAKNALDDFKDLYEKQDDLYQEEIDAYKEKIDSLKDSKEDIVDQLKSEKDILQDKYDTEKDIYDEKIKSAQNSLDDAQKAYDKIKAINDQNLALEQAKTSAIKSSTASGYGGLASGTKLKNIEKTDTIKTTDDIVNQLLGKKEKPANIFEKTDLSGYYAMGKGTKIDTTGADLSSLNIENVDAATTALNNYNTALSSAETNSQITWSSIGETIKGSLNGIIENVGTFFENMGKSWNDNWGIISSMGKTFITEIGSTLSTEWTKISVKASTTFSDIGKFFTDMWITLSTKTGEGINTLGTFFTNLWTSAVTIFGNIVQVPINAINNFVKNVGSFVQSGIDKLGDFLGDAKEWGKHFIENIVEGITGAIDRIKEAAESVGSTLERWLGFSDPPEEGPLHTADTWGSHLVDTYADGIDSNLSVLQSAINKLQGVTIPNNTGTISASVASNYDTASVSNNKSPSGTTINKNYYIQPGQMIATRGEIRNFARLLSEYDTFESGR